MVVTDGMGTSTTTLTLTQTSYTTITTTPIVAPTALISPTFLNLPNSFQCFGAQVYSTDTATSFKNNADVCVASLTAGLLALLAGIVVFALTGTINRREDVAFDLSSTFRRHDPIEFQNPLEQDPAKNRPRTLGERLGSLVSIRWKAGLAQLAPAAERAFQIYSHGRQGKEALQEDVPVSRSARSPDKLSHQDDEKLNEEQLLKDELHDIYHFHPKRNCEPIATELVTVTVTKTATVMLDMLMDTQTTTTTMMMN